MVREDAVVFPCLRCQLAYEWNGEELRLVEPSTASPTTCLAVPTEIRYLSTWRFVASVELVSRTAAGDTDSIAVWERIRKVTSPRPAYLYVPAFSLSRSIVQQLGLRLVEAQPDLQLERGLPPRKQSRPMLVAVDSPDEPPDAGDASQAEEWGRSPWFEDVAPVVVGECDARTLAHFVYLALEAQEIRDLRSIDYRLTLGPAELLFVPATWDPRHIQDSNWRLLLHEFDWLVA